MSEISPLVFYEEGNPESKVVFIVERFPRALTAVVPELFSRSFAYGRIFFDMYLPVLGIIPGSYRSLCVLEGWNRIALPENFNDEIKSILQDSFCIVLSNRIFNSVSGVVLDPLSFYNGRSIGLREFNTGKGYACFVPHPYEIIKDLYTIFSVQGLLEQVRVKLLEYVK